MTSNLINYQINNHDFLRDMSNGRYITRLPLLKMCDVFYEFQIKTSLTRNPDSRSPLNKKLIIFKSCKNADFSSHLSISTMLSCF